VKACCWREGAMCAKQARHAVSSLQWIAGLAPASFGGSMRTVGSGSRIIRKRLATVAALVAIVGGSGFLAACQKNIEGTMAAYADDEPAGVLYNRGLGYMNAGKF